MQFKRSDIKCVSVVIFQLIKDFLNETYTARTGSIPSELTHNVLWSTSVALYLFGGCGGAFSAGPFANKFGR